MGHIMLILVFDMIMSMFGDKQGLVRPLDPVRQLMFIGIKSSAHTAERRIAWRRSKCARLYRREGFPYRFFVGVPQSHNHPLWMRTQGAKATDQERNTSKALLRELRHGDMEIVAMRDQYMDLSNKLLQLLRFGYETGAQYVMAHDDEYCAVPSSVHAAIDTHRRRGGDTYAGEHLWTTAAYKRQIGADGKFAPFFSGKVSFVSRRLLQWIVTPPAWARNALSGIYGTSSDDANMGRWVQMAAREGNLTVSYITQRPMATTVSRAAG
jgi:hypothetical protein